jgi:hypothetical protein
LRYGIARQIKAIKSLQEQADGWTQQKLGEAMGYKASTARKSVSQFLKSRDPVR